SSPSPHAFVQSFQRAGAEKDILVMTLSSQVSSTYHHAVIARHMHQDEHKGQIEVMDSLNASSGLGLIVLKAAQMAKQGLPLQHIVEQVRESVARIRTHVFLESLDNVIKGGRLDKLRGKIASVLNVKLLLCASEQGTLEVMEKVRGSQNAMKRLIDLIGEGAVNYDNGYIAIAHSNCEQRAKDMMEAIKRRYPFKHTMIANMGPVI